MKKAPAASIICIEGGGMRCSFVMWLCAVILASPSAAQDRCAEASIACEMALAYAAKAAEMLPMPVEEFGTNVIAESLTADGPRIALSVVVDLPANEVAKLLEERNGDGASLRMVTDDVLFFAVCDTAEGGAFINAGGEIVVILLSADRKPMATASVQSCKRD